MSSQPMRRVHYVFSSHWDREWYQPFQDYRYRLVQLIDRVLAGWKSGRLHGPFQTDGQSILLEDYLEIRPEASEEVRQRVQEGRFVLGPFYVQPDEFLVSGESLIRNLRLGRDIARSLGGMPSCAGLLCDNFGHNSQMPQIFAGFGIRAAFVWRGTNLVDRRLFIWRGADGAEIPTYRFGAEGYCSYAKFVRQQRLDEPPFSEEKIGQRLNAFLEEESARTRAGPLLAFDGGDHMEWDPPAYTVLLRHIDQPDGRFHVIHSSLDAYLSELLPETGRIDAVLEGELREPGRHPETVDKANIAQGTGSSRVWIKQANAACETLLCRWAEPFASFARAALGIPYPHGFLDTAWKWLLQNHPHDSICGCSIDAVHDDMAYRFRQSKQITNRLAIESTRRLAASVEGEVAEDELRCVVFNPLPRPYQQVAVLDLEIPADWTTESPLERGQLHRIFQITGDSGADLPFQVLEQIPNQPRFRVLDTAFPRGYHVNVVRVALPLNIPPLGYSTLTISQFETAVPVNSPVSVSPAFIAGERSIVDDHSMADHRVMAGHHSMANEFLSVTIAPNGTLTLLDRRNGNTYRDLMILEDSADIGNGWNFGPAPDEHPYLSTGCHAEIIQLQDGPYVAAFMVRLKLELPEEFDFSTIARSKQSAGLVVESRISLFAGADQVEIETKVFNNVCDHRLRVLFPTYAAAATYLADSPFDVAERKIALRPDNHLYRQQEVETRPQQSWTAVYDPPGDSQRGLAVLGVGLYESAVQDTPERSIALTLLRATRSTVFTSGEPGGQVQGELSFNYALVPLASAPDRPGLFDRAARLAAGLRTVQLTRYDDELLRAQPDHPPISLPSRASFLALKGPLVLTSLRDTRAGLEVRLFNPQTSPVHAELDLSGFPTDHQRPTRAVWVDFESQPIAAPFKVHDETVELTFDPKEIKTLWFF